MEKARLGVIYLIALVLSICVHEFGHAWVADRFGDPLPRSQGRVTLNPIAHIDMFGTILLPLLALYAAPAIGSRLIGWGKPVQVSGRRSKPAFKSKVSMRMQDVLISLAGPGSNILFAILLSALFLVLLRFAQGAMPLIVGVQQIIMMNIGLAFFNLIPVPPLDGGGVLANVLPRQLSFIADFLQRYGAIILFVLLLSGQLGILMRPAYIVAHWWMNIVLQIGGIDA